MLGKILREGFTLVELSLSMVFIGILSISIVLITNNTIAAYRRGLTLTRINTVGTELVADIRSAARNLSIGNLIRECRLSGKCDGGSGDDENLYNLILVRKTANINYNGQSIVGAPIYGAFCTGQYSYIWNSGYFYSDNVFDSNNAKLGVGIKQLSLVYIKEEAGGVKEERGTAEFRLAKVKDGSYKICSSLKGPDEEWDGKIELDWKEDNDDYRENILAVKNNNLAIYDLDVTQPVGDPTERDAFYLVSFVLGTVNGGANITATGNACSGPDSYKNENLDYCAINKFNFAVQANGG